MLQEFFASKSKIDRTRKRKFINPIPYYSAIQCNSKEILTRKKISVDVFRSFCYKEKGKKVFMVTNCNFEYSNYIMRYLFSKADICKEANWGEKWINAFDIIFTQAKKPKFFSGQGNSLSAIHTETGLVVPVKGSIKSAMKASGHIFKGGSTADFEEALGKSIFQKYL